MEISQASYHGAYTRPHSAPGLTLVESDAPAARKPFVAKSLQTGADILCLMDLDETTAALVGSTDAAAVNTMGILDGLKVVGLGAARLQMGYTRQDKEAMLDGGARMALGAGSIIPGLVGNFFVGATGAYLAFQGMRHKDKAQAIAGILQIGVAASFYAIGAGAGLPAQAAILALQAGKIGTYFYHGHKQNETTDSDRLGRFMHGYLHRHDHWGQVQMEGRGKVWSDSPGAVLKNFNNLALISKPISLHEVDEPTLAFELRHDLEEGADFMHVEVRHGDQEWTPVKQISGKSDWAEHRVDLSEYQGKEVQVRFRVKTDASGASPGCYLDKVRVECADRSVRVPLQPHEGDLHE
jgi:hypothetical protein